VEQMSVDPPTHPQPSQAQSEPTAFPAAPASQPFFSTHCMQCGVSQRHPGLLSRWRHARMDRHGGAKPARGGTDKQIVTLHSPPRSPSNAPGSLCGCLCSAPPGAVDPQAIRARSERRAEHGSSSAQPADAPVADTRGHQRLRGSPAHAPRQADCGRSVRPRNSHTLWTKESRAQALERKMYSGVILSLNAAAKVGFRFFLFWRVC
jgi:hypothetical protein